jgi:uncharacterized DUF497 family protein
MNGTRQRTLNIAEHGVSFELACRIFEGPIFTLRDTRQDYGEIREISIGQVEGVAVIVVVVVHTERQSRRRLISAHPASARESSRYAKPMTPPDIAATPDIDIDFSDTPELDETFWQNAHLIDPDRTQLVTLRVKKSVLDAYKAQGKAYQTRMNAVLETYARILPKQRCPR